MKIKKSTWLGLGGLLSATAVALFVPAFSQSCSCSKSSSSFEDHYENNIDPSNPNASFAGPVSLLKTNFSLKDLGMEKMSLDDVKAKITSKWFFENKQKLFDNYPNFKQSSITNLQVNQPLPYQLDISFKLNGIDQKITLTKSIEDEYGEVNKNLVQSQSPEINSFNKIEIKIENYNVPRQVNNEYYETDLIKQYGQYGFKYPAWNNNYENEKGDDVSDNGYLTLPSGDKINLSQKVFEERVPGIDKKYSDATWIRSEIKNKTLKKHPAADGIHQLQLSDDQKAVDKHFSLNSSILGISSLGLYAPAGEVVKLQFSKETYDLMKAQGINNFKIILNSSYFDNKGPSDKGRISNRYPFIYSEFQVKISDIDPDTYTYEFGTPFGGTISVFLDSHLKAPNSNSLYGTNVNYDFNVVGAVEMLSYFHGVTTEDDWNQQMNKVKNGEITVGEMSFDFPFGAGNVQFTGLNKIAWVSLTDVVYPKTIIQKWNDFLFLSEYFASRDVSDSIRKLNFRFNDDIWGGGAAYGGG